MLGSSGAASAPGLRAPSPSAPLPGGPYVPLQAPRVRWLPALGYGLLATLVGGLVWGLILGVTEFMSAWVAIIIGVFIAWAVQKGAVRTSGGLIAIVALLTYVAVFFGWIVAISMWIAPLGGSPIDAFAVFPIVVERFPGDIALSFVFGTVGVAAGAWSIWQKMRSQRTYRALPPPLYAPPSPGSPAAALPTGSVPNVERPTLRAVERTATRVAVEVRLPAPEAHVVNAAYNTWNGMAEVFLDGSPFAKGRVWGMSKEIGVPLGGSSVRTLLFRFRGAVKPTIDVSLDGAALGTV